MKRPLVANNTRGLFQKANFFFFSFSILVSSLSSPGFYLTLPPVQKLKGLRDSGVCVTASCSSKISSIVRFFITISVFAFLGIGFFQFIFLCSRYISFSEANQDPFDVVLCRNIFFHYGLTFET